MYVIVLDVTVPWEAEAHVKLITSKICFKIAIITWQKNNQQTFLIVYESVLWASVN